MNWAFYDLGVNPPSYDFVTFMQHALHNGAQAVLFKKGQNGNKKAFEDTEQERFETIILPLVKLYGIEHQIVDIAVGEYCYPDKTSHSHDVQLSKLPKKPFAVMPSQEALDRANDRFKGKRPIVISLRRMKLQYQHGRNSGPDWERWAADHDAFLIPDYDYEKVSIDDRVAYCELASLNMGINSGVSILFTMSLRPFLMLKMLNEDYKVTRARYLEQVGFPVGSQFPWSGKNQKFVWNSKDDYETLESEYQKYMAENG